MSSNAISSYGTLLKIGDGGGSEVFTAVAEVRDMDGPGLDRSMHDVTAHDSGGYEQVVAGIGKTGEISFEINYIPTETTQAGTSGLIALWKNKTKRNMKLVFPDATEFAFAGFVKTFKVKAPVDGVLTASVTVKLTGTPTLP